MTVREQRAEREPTLASPLDAIGLLRAQAAVLRLVAEGRPLEEVLTRLVLAIEASSKSALCSILIFDEDESRLWVGASPSLPDAYNRAIDGIVATPTSGSFGPAVHYRHLVVVTDIARDPLWAEYREPALEAGLRACMAIPILDANGRALGTYAFYYREPTQPDAHDLHLIAASCDLARVVLVHHDQHEEIRRSRIDLERRVRERTDDLAAFTYSVSHDLRAPLRAIESRLTTLTEEHAVELSPAARAHVESARRGAQTMTRLVEDLLELSHAGRRPITLALVTPRACVDEALESLAVEQVGRSVEVSIADLPPCLGDAGLVTRVFQNLLGNALKYTRTRAQARIEVRGERIGDDVCFSVRDNGIGFEMRHAEEIFGAFERLHPSEQYEGSGVGLALVRRIVDRHGGRAWAESRPEEGAVFYATFPAVRRE